MKRPRRVVDLLGAEVVGWVLGIVDIVGVDHVNPADRVNHGAEPVEGRQHRAINRDANIGVNRGAEEIRAGLPIIIGPQTVIKRPVDLVRSRIRDGDIEITWDTDRPENPGLGVDTRDDEHVGVVRTRLVAAVQPANDEGACNRR